MENNEVKMLSLEKKLLGDIKGKELWGDVNLSKDDFDSMIRFLSSYVQSDEYYLKMACENFPVSVTTFLVFVSRYKYNTNFWGAATELLQIDNTQQIEKLLGSCALEMFELFGFDYSDALRSNRKYVDSILFEAGLPPESNLLDLFYIIKYDNQNIFDPLGVIDDLISSRSYAIRKPLLNFLKKYKSDRAIDLLIDVYDAINCVDSNMSGDSPYIENYREWKESEKSTERKNKKENLARPYLKFDDGSKGLCMVLPRFNLADEWIDEVKWIVESSDGYYIERTVIVSEDDSKRYTDSIVLPVSPSKEYYVSLVDGENISDSKFEYTISGVSEKGYLLFNSFGRQTNSAFFPYPGCVMVANDSISIKSLNGISQTRLSYPTDKVGYQIYAFDSIGTNSKLTFTANDNTIELSSKPQVNMTFKGEKLLGLSDNSIFTTIPVLNITVDDDVSTNDLKLKLSISDKELNLDTFFEKKETNIILSDEFDFTNIDGSIKYGSYAVRIYQKNHFLKQAEFCFVPEIKSNYDGIQSWVSKNDRKVRKTFNFSTDDNYYLDFEDCLVKNENCYYFVEVPVDKGLINVRYKAIEENGFSCNFKLPILPFQADVLDSCGNIIDCVTDKVLTIENSEIIKNNTEYWINLKTYGEFKTYRYELRLETVNGTEQSYPIDNMRNGEINLNLSRFYDSVRNSPMPAQIVLSCSESEYSVPLMLIKESVLLSKKPIYLKQGFILLSPFDEVNDLFIKKFGSDEIIPLPVSSSKKVPHKQLGMVRAFKLEKPLEEGLYNLDVEQSDDIFEYNESDISKFSFGINSFYIYNKNGENNDLFSDWLNNIISKSVSRDFSKIKNLLLEDIRKYEGISISQNDYEKLIIIASIYENEKERLKRDLVQKCMNLISSSILTGYDRFNLIKLLTKLHVSEELFNICLQEYNLLIFDFEENDVDLAKDVALYSNELSLLMNLKSNSAIKSILRSEKFMELIGKETIREMLVLTDNEDSNETLFQQKMFINEKSPCKISINLTSYISGEMKPIQDMIKSTSKNVYLDMSKKPDTGVYFFRIRYVDQYLNWYKLNHNYFGDMNQKTKDYMTFLQESYISDIIDCLDFFKKKYGFVSRYDNVLKKRYEGDAKMNLRIAAPARFFYVLGISALIANLKSDEKIINNKLKSAERFITGAISIAPKMTRRDILMSNLYLYLVRKEDIICR